MALYLIIELPQEVKITLSNQLEAIKKEYKYINWMAPQYYHLILHPLGKIEDLQKLIAQIEESIFDIPSTYLYSQKIKIFIKNNIAIYLNFARNKTLEKLVDRLKEKMLINDQREFNPHITVANYKLPSKQQYLLLKKKLGKLDISADFAVEKINLVEGASNKEKPTYKKIAEFSLF